MREIAAFVRQDYLTAMSYRLSALLSIVTMVVTVVPVYYASGALQPVMARAIALEGGDYFSFLLVGLVTMQLLLVALNTLPTAVGSALRTGTLEAMFVTPIRLPTLLAGMMSYKLLWALAQATVLVTVGVVLGAHFHAARALPALGVLALVLVAYAAIGVLATAMQLVFRTHGPLLAAALIASNFLGGVYFPTSVIPSWLQYLSYLTPLTYGLRAMRQLVLTDLPMRAVVADVAILAAIAAAFLALGMAAIYGALRYGRRTGSLAHY